MLASVQPSGPRRPPDAHRYPTQLVERVALADGRVVTIRPVLPQDAAAQRAFIAALSVQARRWRFHGPVRELPDHVLRYMTEVDYTDHMALLAETADGSRGEQVAEARWVRRTDDPQTADFAIVVHDDWQRGGLGTRLLQRLIESAADRGVQRMCGDVLSDNRPMRNWLTQRRGWRFQIDPDDPSTLSAEREITQSTALKRAA